MGTPRGAYVIQSWILNKAQNTYWNGQYKNFIKFYPTYSITTKLVSTSVSNNPPKDTD